MENHSIRVKWWRVVASRSKKVLMEMGLFNCTGSMFEITVMLINEAVAY